MEALQILLLDPEPRGRQVLARLLRMSGFGVREVANDLEARLAALDRRFDVLISEISPPACSEFALIQLLRRVHETRGIVLTAHAPGDVGGWRRAGFSLLLRKPIAYDRLLGRVRKLLMHREFASHRRRPDGLAGVQLERCLETQAVRLWAIAGATHDFHAKSHAPISC